MSIEAGELAPQLAAALATLDSAFSTAFDYPTIWRVLNELDKTDEGGAV